MPTSKRSAPTEPAAASTLHRPAGVAPGRIAPVFRDLTPGECRALLACHHVGPLAYTFHDRVAIEPIHYVYEDGWIYGRTSPGSKVNTIAHHPWVALEVDEVDGVFDWRSVVAHGSFYRLETDGTAAERESWRRAVQLLDAIVPGTLAPNDPVPFRNIVFHIYVDEMTGRAAYTEAPSTHDTPGRAD